MKSEHEWIPLNRDCEAIRIPSGEKVILPQGTEVMIMQNMGGSYTVATDEGTWVRIAGKDGTALGMEGEKHELPQKPEGADLEKLVWDQLRTLFDPEIPVNVVDLGLIYSCRISELSSQGNRVEVEMTLTAPGCGMGNVLKSEAEEKIRNLPGVKEVNVQVVFDPPWDPSRMSEVAKVELGWM